MRVRPVSPDILVTELAARLAVEAPQSRLRVAIDAAAAAAPDLLAAALVAPLRERGRPVAHVAAVDFLRPASLRYEFGRTNPDTFYAGWLDDVALRREVLDPAGPGGSGRVLPSLWNTATDRATRAAYLRLPPGAVLLVSGSFLLGAGLGFDLTVHLELSTAALARRTPPGERWTLSAYDRYAREVRPADLADIVVRYDDPRHPALVERL